MSTSGGARTLVSTTYDFIVNFTNSTWAAKGWYRVAYTYYRLEVVFFRDSTGLYIPGSRPYFLYGSVSLSGCPDLRVWSVRA
jgi:hypothetical protein